MVEHTIDSKYGEYGPGTSESELPIKQLPVSVKKEVLRDLQNVNNLVPNSIGNTSVSKDSGPLNDAPRVSGTKRPLPECPISPSQHQSPSSSAANAQLVYVRRKAEADVVRSSTCDNASINADCQVSSNASNHEASTQPETETKERKVSYIPTFAPRPTAAPAIPSGTPRKAEADVVRSSTCDSASINADDQISSKANSHEASTPPITETKESEVSYIPAFAPLPMAAPAIPSGTPAVFVSNCNSGTRVAPPGPNCHPLASATPMVAGSKGLKNLHWEERFHQLQLLLRKLDQSEHEDYLQMLRSLSSVELSRHAVELEKRSIQLSLEEVKEMQRVGYLNVLGKPLNQFKVPSTHQDQPEK